MRIVLIGCTKKKLDYECKAETLYSLSNLFSKELEYAKKVIKGDKIFVLSAKYHLLSLDKIIAPYNKSLNEKGITKKERIEWADSVLKSLIKEINVNDEIYFLCGKRYYEYLKDMLIAKEFKNLFFPLFAIGGIGKQLSYLKEKIENV